MRQQNDAMESVDHRQWFGLLGFWAVMIGCVLLRGTPPWPVNHDCGWYLYVADRLLEGDALYVDIAEVNPPLIAYLSILPAALSRLFSIGLVPAFDAFVLVLIGIAMVSLHRVVGVTASVSRDRWPLLAGIGVVLIVCPGGDFGQREHLMMISFLPWLAIVIARMQGAHITQLGALGVGVLAGVGIALKPWFVIAPIFVRCATTAGLSKLWTQRRPEDLGLLLMLVVYGFYFLVSPSTDDFLRVVNRLVETYDAMNADVVTILQAPWFGSWAWMFGLVAVCAVIFNSIRAALRVLGLASLVFAGIAVLQHKGWSYHFLPALSAAYLGLGLVVFYALNRVTRVRWMRQLLWFGGLLALTAVPMGEHWFRRDASGFTWESEASGIPADMPEIKGLRAGDCVMVLDTDMPPFFAWLADHGVRWGSRYAHLWPLPRALVDADQWQQLIGEIAADIEGRRPRWIYIRRGSPSYCPTVSPDFCRRLVTSPEVGLVLKQYQKVRSAGRFEVWRAGR